MKTKTVLALTLVGITTLFVPLTTEARGFWDNIIKIPQKIDVNNIIKNTSVKNYNINLDGTYYGVSVSKASGYKNNDKIMTATFYISRPCFVKFHGITNGYQAAAIYRIYDQDGYQVCSRLDIGNNRTQDKDLFLKPGRYNIDVNFYSTNTQGNLETRFKMEAESLNVTAENNTSVFSAQPLNIGVATANYFRSIKEWSNDTVQHYYSIDVAYPYNLHIYAKKMQEGRMSMILLDADERQIGRTMYCNDNIIDENVMLNPGRYYLRVKREEMLGAYYSVRID